MAEINREIGLDTLLRSSDHATPEEMEAKEIVDRNEEIKEKET